MSRRCTECGSRWPALVTLEAFKNRIRMDRWHSGRKCHDDKGEFGPIINAGKWK